MGILSKVAEYGHSAVATVATAGNKVLAVCNKKLMSLACVAALAVTAVPALAEDASGSGSGTTTDYSAAKTLAEKTFKVDEMASFAYEMGATTIGKVAIYIICFAVISLGIFWVVNLIRQAKKK